MSKWDRRGDEYEVQAALLRLVDRGEVEMFVRPGESEPRWRITAQGVERAELVAAGKWNASSRHDGWNNFAFTVATYALASAASVCCAMTGLRVAFNPEVLL
jgi:hypothetical protein